mmetsp:Transcript_158796/g.289522  ORF Transcript_158796/g.289522 Transcript_158796/m.289522 type:complete len:247 (-) Transcript_158796:36-776(-)
MSGKCELMGWFGIAVQLFIAVWCFLTLLFMWRIETHRRSCGTWFFDMSKQGAGAAWGHVMNVIWAIVCGNLLKTGTHHNQCVWYLVGFLSDIIFCTFLSWAANAALRPIFLRRCKIDIGDYEGNTDTAPAGASGTKASGPSVSAGMWMCQTFIWLGILTVVKIVVSIGCWLGQDFLYTSIADCFRAFGLVGHDRAQLIASVIIVPVIGDAFQFAVQDTFLKRKKQPADDSSLDYQRVLSPETSDAG